MDNDVMNVQELINELEKVTDKSKPVICLDNSSNLGNEDGSRNFLVLEVSDYDTRHTIIFSQTVNPYPKKK